MTDYHGEHRIIDDEPQVTLVHRDANPELIGESLLTLQYLDGLGWTLELTGWGDDGFGGLLPNLVNLRGLAEPFNDTDATNKKYVDRHIHVGDEPPAAADRVHGGFWIDTSDTETDSLLGIPVATYSWPLGSGGHSVSGPDYAGRETIFEQVIPNTSGKPVEAVFDCSGYSYGSTATDGASVLQLEYSEDGGTTWLEEFSSRVIPSVVPGMQFIPFSLHARYSGTPTSDVRVRLTGYHYTGDILSVNRGNSELVAQIFFAGPAILDNRYLLATMPFAKYQHTSGQSLTAGQHTQISFDTIMFSQGEWTSASTSGVPASAITIPESGVYEVGVNFRFDTSPDSGEFHQTTVTRNSASVSVGASILFPQTAANYMVGSDMFEFATGDVLRVFGYHTRSNAITVSTWASIGTLSIRRVA